jgi:hypothetical protein
MARGIHPARHAPAELAEADHGLRFARMRSPIRAIPVLHSDFDY